MIIPIWDKSTEWPQIDIDDIEHYEVKSTP